MTSHDHDLCLAVYLPAPDPLHDDIPAVVRPGTRHDGGQDGVRSEHLTLLSQLPDDGVVRRGDVVEEAVSHLQRLLCLCCYSVVPGGVGLGLT